MIDGPRKISTTKSAPAHQAAPAQKAAGAHQAAPAHQPAPAHQAAGAHQAAPAHQTGQAETHERSSAPEHSYGSDTVSLSQETQEDRSSQSARSTAGAGERDYRSSPFCSAWGEATKVSSPDIAGKAGEAALTNVNDYVSEKAGQAGGYVSEKATQGANWVKSDDTNSMGNLKYANPMYFQGKPTEYAGKAVKWVGEKINGVAGAIDKAVNSTDSKLVNNPVVGGALGRVSGALGFVGGLAEGVGSLADYGGRVMRGDKKTIDDTVSTVKSTGEGAAYIQGKAREYEGTLVEKTGDALGSDTIKNAGRGLQDFGQFSQSLASDNTKKVIDTAAGAGVHYAGHLVEKGGQDIKGVGDTVGSDTVSKVGDQVGQDAQIMQKTTENNALVGAIDKAVDEREKEYKEHGDYAISRDTMRVALEVASLVVAPEALIGKAGEGANIAGKVGKGVEMIDKAADVAKVADKAADVAKVATVTDATRAVNGAATVTDATKAAKAAWIKKINSQFMTRDVPIYLLPWLPSIFENKQSVHDP